jgi:hypothetical protein
MDADRLTVAAALTPDPIDPGANLPARQMAAIPERGGAVISETRADDSVKHQYVSMRAQAGNVDGLSALDSLAGAVNQAAPAGAVAGAAKAAQAMPALVPQPPQPLAARIVNGTKSVALDIGKGALEAPGQIVGGVLDYGNNLMKFADDVVRQAEDKGLPNVYFRLFDKDGNWAPQMESIATFRKAQKEGRDDVFQVPTTGDPDTITGNILRTGASFLVGRGNIAGKGAGLAKNLLADVVSGATALDAKSPRLSNLIDQVAPNAVTDFLKAKPEDEGTILAHIKSGLEMGGVGAAVTGIVRTLKATKAALAATPAPEVEAGAAEGAAPTVAPAAAEAVPGVEASVTSAAEAPPKTALDHLLAMESDLPFQEGPTPTRPGLTQAASAAAKEAGGVGAPPDEAAKQALAMGYPAAKTGHPLAPAGEMATVEVSPELKGRFEQFMAQERGELAAPLEANEKPLAAMKSADFSATGANPVKVNLNMINGPADLKDAIARVSAQIPAQAVRHNDAVLEAAHSLGMDAETFLAGPGRALGDSEVVGLRMVANDVARQALDHFKAAALPGADEEAKATALASYAKFNDLIAYMEGAKAESGRSVQAWGIQVAGMRVPYADAVKRIAAVAGEPGSPEFLERMAALETPEQVAAAARATRSMTARDWMMYGWYNALLGPRTVVKKGLSDAFMGLWNLTTRYAAERMGPEGGVQAGETAALLQGYKQSFGDALALARKAFIEGRSQFHGGSQFLESFDHGQALADSAPQVAEEAPTMAMRDFMRVAASPKSYLPTTWIGAIDDFATMLNYQAERHALAYRWAAGKGLEGDELQSAIANVTSANPSWLHHQATAAALQNTFKEPLEGVAANLAAMVDGMNIPVGHGTNFELPVGRIIMPFVKIPTNIARWSYTNSPLPLLMPSSRITEQLAAGGAAKDLALARIGLGTALSTSLAGLALSGTITGRGPSDPQLQRAWQAAHGGDMRHSVRVGDQYYTYNSVEPVGLMAGIVADTYDIMRFAKEEDSGQAALSLVFGAGEALMSKTYLEGVAELFKALEDPDKQSARWFDKLVASAAVPNTVAQFAQALDPWMRQHYHLLDAIEAKLPYLSQGLPPQRTLWGDAIPAKDGYAPFFTGTAAAKMLSPITVGPKADAEPIDKWIFDNRMAFPRGPDNKLGITKPGIVQNFAAGPHIDAQVELTPEQHDRLQVLAGNELKDPTTGMGAKDTLNALVEGRGAGSMQRQWDTATNAERALVVQTVVNKFRAAAKQQLIGEFPDLQDAVSAGWQARSNALTH